MQTRTGFTLVELSIVLVIIGLIIGGVLVGRTLIEAASVRAQIAQIEQFKTAVNTFRTRFNAIPRICSTPQRPPLAYIRSGQPGDGDGNGIIESCYPQGSFRAIEIFGCETAVFGDLSDAELVAGNFTGDTDGFIEMDDGQQEQFIPAGKIGNQNFIAVYGGTLIMNGATVVSLSGDAITYGLVQGITSEAGDGAYTFVNAGVTPGQAFAIDTKMDDGMPLTGTVLGGPTNRAGGLTIGIFGNSCYLWNSGDSTYDYQLSAATVDVPSCIMNFQ